MILINIIAWMFGLCLLALLALILSLTVAYTGWIIGLMGTFWNSTKAAKED